ncbi:22933_t:CDS:1, partial [Cetraspora pellucida]
NIIDLDKYLSQEEFEFLKTLDLIKNDAVLDTGIHFIQIRVSDPERPHDNLNLLSNWEALVPSIKNLRYEFIKPISDYKEYNETPYMP